MDNMKDKQFYILNRVKNDIDIESGTFFSFFIHSHTFYEMTLYEPFNGYITVNDTDIEISTPTLVMIAPFDFHKGTHISGENGRYLKIGFTEDVFFTGEAPKTSMMINNLSNGDAIIGLYNELKKSDGDTEYSKILINAVVSIIKKHGSVICDAEKKGKKKISTEAVRIINEKLNSSISLSSVANDLYITPQYLSNTFKKEVGISFSDYLTTLRLRRAKKMLSETALSITEICQACGYGNFSHFLRSFKKEYGVSPTVYRKSSQKKFNDLSE